MPREINLKIRRGTASDWASVNPTLASGEMALENDTRRMKVGDGSAAWNELRYLGLDGGDIDPVTASVATETGTDVRVEAFAQTGTIIGVALDFSEISGSGTTTVQKVTEPGNPDLPANFSLSDALGSYSITTTATFTGNVLVSFVLPASVTQEVFETVRIFKLTSGVTTDVTVLDGPNAPDYATRTIYASVDGFSEFYLIPWSFPPTPTPTATPMPTATPTPTPEPIMANYLGGSFTATDPGLKILIRGGRLNSDGTADSGFAVGTGFNNTVNSIAVQSNGKILVGGSFTSYNGTSINRIIRLNNDGTVDSSFTVGTGFDGAVNSIAVQSNGKILVGGSFTSYNGTSINRIIRLNNDGTVDSGFAVGTGFSGEVRGIAVQGDGKILVGGSFTSYNGTSRNRIIRLNSNGTVDSGFTVGTGFNNTVNNIAVQGDGKILIGGSFTSYNGTSINRIIRLNSDGTVDSSFTVGTGFNNTVNNIAVQGDGKILIGGSFTSYNGTSINRIIRLNSDGTVDSSFTVGTGFDGAVNSIAVQSDGKILFVGSFTSYNGTSINRIIRLNSDGTVDSSFTVGTGFNFTVNSVTVQSNGKILVGGIFTGYDGTSRGRIVGLGGGGTVDSSFNIGTGFNDEVRGIAVQGDGKILAGGGFTNYNGNSRNRIIRLNSDGTVDSGFTVGTGFNAVSPPRVNDIAVQGDGKILVGGSFTSYNGTSRNRIIRLNSDGSADSSFNIGTGFNDTVNKISIQSDGKILVGGDFRGYNGTSINRIIRLNSDGTADSGFTIGTGFDNAVFKITVQGDGKVLAAGAFTSYNGTSINRIIRLNSDGTVDSSFTVGTGFNSTVYSIAVQSDGKILVGGFFTSYNGTSSNRIIRLNSDGTVDSGFTVGTGFDSFVFDIIVQGDGKILAGGSFASYNGTSRNYVAKLNSDGTLDNSFDFDTNDAVSVVI